MAASKEKIREIIGVKAPAYGYYRFQPAFVPRLGSKT